MMQGSDEYGNFAEISLDGKPMPFNRSPFIVDMPGAKEYIANSWWRKQVKPGVIYVVRHNDTGKLFAGYKGSARGKCSAKWTSDPEKACRYLLPFDLATENIKRWTGESASRVLLSEYLASCPKKRTRKARAASPRETAVIENIGRDLGELVNLLQAGNVSEGLQLAEGLLYVVNQ